MRQEAGNYKNSGSDHNRGLTWTYVPRTPYAGKEVTWANKKEILADAMREYKSKHPEASIEDCWIWGKSFVSRQRKHEKAYRKGLSFYKHNGGIFPVEDKSRMETFVEAAKAFNEKVEQKMAEDKLKETDGKVEELVKNTI
jgi:predicted transcriptional regulator